MLAHQVEAGGIDLATLEPSFHQQRIQERRLDLVRVRGRHQIGFEQIVDSPVLTGLPRRSRHIPQRAHDGGARRPEQHGLQPVQIDRPELPVECRPLVQSPAEPQGRPIALEVGEDLEALAQPVELRQRLGGGYVGLAREEACQALRRIERSGGEPAIVETGHRHGEEPQQRHAGGGGEETAAPQVNVHAAPCDGVARLIAQDHVPEYAAEKEPLRDFTRRGRNRGVARAGLMEPGVEHLGRSARATGRRGGRRRSGVARHNRTHAGEIEPA